MSQQPRIRKSLSALIGTDERRGYFYCLKLLGVLPPPPGSGFDKWVFSPPPAFYLIGDIDQPAYTPKSLQDVLIASHAATCQHNSFYFAFYHRNLMVLTELFLNFAHEVMRGGFQKLKSVYHESQYAQLYEKQKLSAWQNVFDKYASFKGIPEQIANHYWNPTDFPSDLDLQLPQELSPRQSPTEPIDILFEKVNHYHPWETNIPTRWFVKPPARQAIIKTFSEVNQPYQYFSQTDPTYTNGEEALVKPLLEGKLDPRTSDISLENINNFLNNWKGNLFAQATQSNPYNWILIAHRNLKASQLWSKIQKSAVHYNQRAS